MDKRDFKDKVYSLLAKMIRAMANAHRLEIIDLLIQGEKSVEEIACETNMTTANASQHLQILKSENLVSMRKEKNFIHYRLANEEVFHAWKNLRELGIERSAGVSRVINDFCIENKLTNRIHIDELLKKINSRQTVLLDVRPEKEYCNGHIPKALNIPPGKLFSHFKNLSKSKEYIAYCRGPFCVFADEAVRKLNRKGFKAKRLVEGFPDWKAKGLAVEVFEKKYFK